MKEMTESNLRKIDGGIVGIDDALVAIAIGIGISAGGEILSNWDDFKRGLMSAF